MDKFSKNIKLFHTRQKHHFVYEHKKSESILTKTIKYLETHPIDNRNSLGHLFNVLELLGKGAEIGVQEGKFSQILLDTWHGEQLYLIDSWKHYSDNEYIDTANISNAEHEELFQKVLMQFSSNQRIKINRAESLKAANEYPDNFFDWIFLDANHSYEHCSADLRAWYPKIKSNGIFSGHDFINKHDQFGLFGVERAVREHIKHCKCNLFITQHDNSWYFVK